MSSLKLLVNNKALWDSFNEHVDAELNQLYSRLSVADEVLELHRIQGEIRALKRLKYLREKVNGHVT